MSTMPHNLVTLAVAARENIGTRHDVLPHVDDANSSDDKHTAPDDEVYDRHPHQYRSLQSSKQRINFKKKTFVPRYEGTKAFVNFKSSDVGLRGV